MKCHNEACSLNDHYHFVADFCSNFLLRSSCCPQPPEASGTVSYVPLCCWSGVASSVLALRRAYNLSAYLQADEGALGMEVQKRQAVPQLHVSNISCLRSSVLGTTCLESVTFHKNS